MNVRAPKQMIVMLTPCAPTLKVLICVAVLESLKETGKLAQVGCLFFCMIRCYFDFFERKKKVEQTTGMTGCFFCLFVFLVFYLCTLKPLNKRNN